MMDHLLPSRTQKLSIITLMIVSLELAKVSVAKLSFYYLYLHGGLAQLGEHLPYKQRVGGSSPSSPTIYNNCADLAQLVEQLTCNQ